MKLKKSVGVLLTILILFSMFLVIAEENQEQTEIEKAYSCLKNELGDNCGNTQSTKQNSFNLLASSYDSGLQSECKSALLEKERENCWGETDTGNCNIKSTALAALALNQIGEDTGDYIEWLLSKRKTNTGLSWFLEIDATNETKCTINGNKVIIKENKKIAGTSPGLKTSYYGYWFEIKDITRNYTISCDKDFITALVFQKPRSNIYYISSDTNSASEYDSITEKVESYCFSTSGICDYEGSLWAALTLVKTGEDISSYLPYLISMSDATENKKFLPSAFLYILTNSDDYYNDLISLQKRGNYWDESKNKFYDTAVALLALQDITVDEVERAKRYLFSVQKDSGCWQSDTAFLLHAGWPKTPAPSGGGVSIQYCEDFNYFCTSYGKCPEGKVLYNFNCESSAKICCETEPKELTCQEKFGVTCELNQKCVGEKTTSSDSSDCCLGDCKEIETENECQNAGYYCKDSCSENQEEKTYVCDLGEVCCANKPKEKSRTWLLILLLIVLIVLVILAIIFRNQIKVWIFKRKSGLKSQKTGSRSHGPGAVFPMPRQLIPRRPLPQRRPGRPPAKSSSRDKEFEDTMKKLRDMSK